MEIPSDIKHFKGTVYIPDFFTLQQVIEYSKALDEVAGLEKIKKWDRDAIMLPAVLACIERMEVEKQPEHPTPKTFRFTPAEQGDEFLSKIITEISILVMGEEEIPNA